MSYSYLALGDSYTIGEGLPVYDNFPYQAVQLLRSTGKALYAPEIVARTGWTTDELESALNTTHLLPSYHFVSLLIGVNNEYRGRSLTEYAEQFEVLLEKAIGYAQKRPSSSAPPPVFVLSIPDWSASPFADTYLPDTAGRSKAFIAAEIDAFNATAQLITANRGIEFIDITQHSRKEALLLPTPFATDGLHPSAQVYHYWAEQLVERINRYCSAHPY